MSSSAENDALVFWFTGLSGSGKTTIATSVADHIRKMGKQAKIFDGDDVRNILHRHLGFTPEDITENNRLIAHICVQHQKKADCILVPVISPFEKTRKEARTIIGGRFVEVYVKASLDEVIRRDVKGLYEKAINGRIENFIGISGNVPYEEPRDPDIVLDTEKLTVKACASALMTYVQKDWKRRG